MLFSGLGFFFLLAGGLDGFVLIKYLGVYDIFFIFDQLYIKIVYIPNCVGCFRMRIMFLQDLTLPVTFC